MRKIGLLFVCLLSCVAVWAQSLEIKKEFTKEPYSSVLVKFANEFREHEMPDMAPGERFPYAAICVNLKVTAARWQPRSARCRWRWEWQRCKSV